MGASPSQARINAAAVRILRGYADKLSTVVAGKGADATVSGAGPEGLGYVLRLDTLRASNGEVALMPALIVTAPDGAAREFRDHVLDVAACVNCVLAERHGARVWVLLPPAANRRSGDPVEALAEVRDAPRIFADLGEAVLVQVNEGNAPNLWEALSLAPDLARLLRPVPAFAAERDSAWEAVKHRYAPVRRVPA